MEKEIVYVEKGNKAKGLSDFSRDNVSSFLQCNPLFSRLNRDEINHLSGYFNVKEYSTGEMCSGKEMRVEQCLYLWRVYSFRL